LTEIEKKRKKMLEKKETKTLVESAIAKVSNLNEKQEKLKAVITNIRFKDPKMYEKVKLYASKRGMTVNAVMLNALAEQGILD